MKSYFPERRIGFGTREGLEIVEAVVENLVNQIYRQSSQKYVPKKISALDQIADLYTID